MRYVWIQSQSFEKQELLFLARTVFATEIRPFSQARVVKHKIPIRPNSSAHFAVSILF